MKCHYACQSAEHLLERRKFLGTLAGAAGMAAIGFPRVLQAAMPELAADAKAHPRHLAGRRPEPIGKLGSQAQDRHRRTVPRDSHLGARHAHQRAAAVHGQADAPPGDRAQRQHEGRRSRQGALLHDDRPAAGAGGRLSALGRRGGQGARAADSPLPGHIHIASGGGGGGANDAAFLGPKYASIMLGNGNPPQNTERPASLSEAADAERNAFRRQVNDHFARRRRTADSDAFTSSFEQAQQLMERRDVFDVTKEPAADLERYGKHEFGRHCLLARRLLEHGVSCVQVNHSNYDTHNENFDFHIEQLGEFDRTFATLVEDLVERGLWKSTLLVVMSEFGRTPQHQSVSSAAITGARPGAWCWAAAAFSPAP